MSNVRQDADETSGIAVDCKWVELRSQDQTPAGSNLLERQVGTVTTIEQSDQASVYSFKGLIRYAVDDDAAKITVHEYSGTGMLLEGIDRGAITYKNVSHWEGAVRDGRQFEVRGRMSWADAFNSDCVLDVLFRGSLLETKGIAYLTTAIRGAAALGEAEPGRLLMDVPALM